MITFLMSTLGLSILVCMAALAAVYVVSAAGSTFGSARLGILHSNIRDNISPTTWIYLASLTMAGAALLLTAGGLPWQVLGR